MTAIEAFQRPEAPAPRRSEPPRGSRRFGDHLAEGVDGTAPDGAGTERWAAPGGATDEPDDPSTDGTSEPVAGAAPGAAPAIDVTSAATVPLVAPASIGGAEVSIDSVTTPIVAEASSGGPRINNGGACSCCTPGALRPSETDAIAASSVVDRTAMAGALPPPSTTPVLAPPAGPAVPLSPPERALPPPAPGEAPRPSAEQPVGARSDQQELVTELGAPASTVAAPVVGFVPPVVAAAKPSATAPTAQPSNGSVDGIAEATATGLRVAADTSDASTDDDTADAESHGAERSGDPVSATATVNPVRSAVESATPVTGGLGTTSSEPSRAAGPSVSEGVLRSEQVRVMRELAPNREVQRLAFELDGARVAVRFDQDGARVNVVADPANRLGTGWADNVQRTLDAGARQNSMFQQRDADGGRRQRHDRARQDALDERTAADFAARLGTTERG